MLYKELCCNLGIEKFSKKAEEAYIDAEQRGIFNKELLDFKYEKWFPDYHAELRAAEAEIRKSEALVRYTLFLRDVYYRDIDTDIPFPTSEKGKNGKNLAPLFALLGFVEDTVKKLQDRNIPADMQKKVLGAFEKELYAHREKYGFIGIDPGFFFWARHYLAPDIFPIGSLEFELTNIPDGETVLLEKKTGKLLHVRDFSDRKGKPVKRSGAEGKETVFPGEIYEVLAAREDTVLSVHIPKKADLSEKALSASFEEAERFFKKYFPEKDIRGFYCCSWLMDPALSEILPEGAKIISFQNFFKRYPVKSTGKEIFVFILPETSERLEDIPETTSLFRAVKKRYLDNDPIYVYAGVHFWR